MREPAPFENASYNSDDQLVAANGHTYEYDANGNLTGDGQNTYTWDARKALVGVSGPSLSATFWYDAFGRRRQSTVNGSNTSYLYDGRNVIQETEGTSRASYLLGLATDQRYARTDSGGTKSYLSDALGSTVALVGASGGLSTTYSYDPFGQSSTSGEASTNPYRFVGRELDGTGLQFNRARYYDPRQQRFIGQDPQGFTGSGPNLYAYGLDNPTNRSDPTGEDLGGLGKAAECVLGGLKKKVECVINVKEKAREWWEEHVPQCKPTEAPIGGQCHGKGPEPPSIPPPGGPVPVFP